MRYICVSCVVLFYFVLFILDNMVVKVPMEDRVIT